MLFCRWIGATEQKIDEIPCIFPANREFGLPSPSAPLGFGLPERSSLLTASSSGESVAAPGVRDGMGCALCIALGRRLCRSTVVAFDASPRTGNACARLPQREQ